MLLLALLMAILLGVGCASAPHSPPTLASGPTASFTVAELNRALAVVATQPAGLRDYRIGPEDLLDITVFNITGSAGSLTPRNLTVRVSQQGVITLPLIGEVPASGVTVLALEQALRQRYDKYIHNPQIGVMVKEYRSLSVSVIGAVAKPGGINLMGRKTLMDVLVLAGGLAPTAGTQIHLYREEGGRRETHVIDLMVLKSKDGFLDTTSVNLYVQHGDVINVPQAGTFFVDGAVRGPGSYPLGQRYTLTQALTRAGGINRDLADTGEILIIRQHGAGEAERLLVDVDDVIAGNAPDPKIEADDMIIVQTSTGKWIYQQFFRGALTVPNMIPSPTMVIK